MPHQCTNCGRGFEDGSKEMLSGCPDCGGTKFQFRPADASTQSAPDAEPPDPPEPGDNTVAKTVGKTASTVRNLVSTNDSPEIGADETDDAGIDPDETDQSDDTAIDANATDTEDAAQASARGDVVSPDELPSNVMSDGDEHRFEPADSTSEHSTDGDKEDADGPDLDDLREELNEQFESIKVVEPGQYELNLMELYDREEYIVALEEDGRYSIQVPEAIGK